SSTFTMAKRAGSSTFRVTGNLRSPSAPDTPRPGRRFRAGKPLRQQDPLAIRQPSGRRCTSLVVEEKRLAYQRLDHVRIEGLRDQESWLRPLAGEQPLRESRNEDDWNRRRGEN